MRWRFGRGPDLKWRPKRKPRFRRATRRPRTVRRTSAGRRRRRHTLRGRVAGINGHRIVLHGLLQRHLACATTKRMSKEHDARSYHPRQQRRIPGSTDNPPIRQSFDDGSPAAPGLALRHQIQTEQLIRRVQIDPPEQLVQQPTDLGGRLLPIFRFCNIQLAPAAARSAQAPDRPFP